MFFTDMKGDTEKVYGSKPYNIFENALLKLLPNAIKTNYEKTWSSIFLHYKSLTASEFSELIEIPRNECEDYLDKLVS